MSKVYLVQNSYTRDDSGLLRPRFDLSGVAMYGEIIEVLDGRLSPMATSPAMSEMRHALRNYCDDDFILALGAPAFLVAAGAIAAGHNNGRVHVLHWDKSMQKYFPLTLDANNQTKEKRHE